MLELCFELSNQQIQGKSEKYINISQVLPERKKKYVMLYFRFICKIQVDYVLDRFKLQLILICLDFERECLPNLDIDISMPLKTDLLFISCNLMMMTNWFCGLIDQQKALGLKSPVGIAVRGFSLSQIFDTRIWTSTEFEPVQSLSSGFVELRCTVIITINHCTT